MPGGPHPHPKRLFDIPYQVDFTVESKGRHLDITKRRLVWKFGFAHPPAVFPHLFDDDENYVGPPSPSDDGASPPPPSSRHEKKGVECRGREHEIMLTWSLLTGKAHIYVDSREIYRHEPVSGEGGNFLNFLGASFHRGFDLPDHRHNGRHRINLRCYALTPLGARNMAVNDAGETFRRYDLSVDGMSYFSMPAVYELGTDRMWEKVSRWGMMRSGTEGVPVGGRGDRAGGERMHVTEDDGGGDFGRKGRLVDEYYFDKATRRSGAETAYGHDHRVGGGRSISNSEHKAMSPRSESEEQRMVRIAMEASLKEWEENRTFPRVSASPLPPHPRHGSSSEENDGSYGNGRSASARRENKSSKLTSIGEDNLIDFGNDNDDDDDGGEGAAPKWSTDVSVMDDDATTTSFAANAPPAMAMPPTQYHAGRMHPVQQTYQDPAFRPQYAQQTQNQQHQQYQDPTFRPQYAQQTQNQQQQYQDPTFRPQYAQQRPWSDVGTISSTPITPRGMMPSDASFAVPPPPTWDDYNNAFGSSSSSSVVGGGIGYTVTTNNPITSPMSTNSVGMASPMAYGTQQQARQQQWQSQPFGASGGGGGGPIFVGGGPSSTGGGPSQMMARGTKFDPFAS